MPPKRSSIIWIEPKEDFQNRVNQCSSIADIVRSFGFAVGATNYRRIRQRVREDDIDISHIPLGPESNKGRAFIEARKHVSAYLYEGSLIGSHALKLRLIRDEVMDNQCVKCHNPGMWQGKPLSLHLDHKNGVRDDNRIDNLRLLCPNCHAQTATYCGKHKSLSKCRDCGTKTSSPRAKYCRKCHSKHHPQLKKFDPSREELERLVWQKPSSEIAKDFGVSDTSIVKRCRKLGIKKPPRGYWQKQQALSAIKPRLSCASAA